LGLGDDQYCVELDIIGTFSVTCGSIKLPSYVGVVGKTG